MPESLLAALVLLALGLVTAFFGYPLFRLLVMAAGAAWGFANGPAIASGLVGGEAGPFLAFAVALLAATVVGLLAWLAFWLIVFLAGASFGYAVVDAVTQNLVLPWLGAALLGAVAVAFQRVLIVLLTAITGSWLAVSAVLLLAFPGGADGPLSVPREPWVLLFVLVLAALAAVTQFRRVVPPSRA